MNTMKKLLTLLLAAVMVLGLAACGGEPAAPKETTAAPVNTLRHEGSEPRKIVIGVSFDMWYDSNDESLEDDPSYSGGANSELRFDNVSKIEEKYNVTFEFVNLTYSGVRESLNTSTLAGTPECDAYMVDLNFGIPAVLNGLTVDLSPIIDPNRDILNDQNAANYLDLGDGKICMFRANDGSNPLDQSFPLAFNMDLLEENNLEDPRDLYERDEWTWDKFLEYCQVLTQDTNNDGVNDQFGFSGFAYEAFPLLMMSNGASIASGPKETLSSPETGEVLQFYSDLYNTYNVCEPYVDNADVMRYTYRNGNIGFWPSSAWIIAQNNDYDWDGSAGTTLDFDTAFVQWPVGPSGSKETNKSKIVAGNFFVIPVGVKQPELVYAVMEDYFNWFEGDVSVRDFHEGPDWYHLVAGKDEQLQDENYQVMYDVGMKELFDPYKSFNIDWNNMMDLINGTVTAAQFQETYKQQFQDAIDVFYGNK